MLCWLAGGTILGTSNDHRLKRHHHHHHHNHQHGTHEPHDTADQPTTSEGSSSSSTDDESDTNSSSTATSGGASSSGSSRSGASSPTSQSAYSSSSGRRSAGGSPLFQTYEDRLEAILDKLEFWKINMLLVIGGQGGNQLAAQLADGCQRRGIPCCIAGVSNAALLPASSSMYAAVL